MLRYITEKYPDVLFEGCSGGGGRFDAGMLCYHPQIWASDDSDAIERLRIQEGTAICYPLSTIGSHVTMCPNHQVGRTTPFSTRANVATFGTFGYELNVALLSREEKGGSKGADRTLPPFGISNSGRGFCGAFVRLWRGQRNGLAGDFQG